jgi:gluconokinase
LPFFEFLNMILIIMGVSGSGKSTIAKRVGKELNLPFYDADNFHPIANVKKMANGQPLNDADRQPWLEILAENLTRWKSGKGAVLACSALKELYRKILFSKVKTINWIYLDGDFDLILNRMNQRKGHFMRSEMLQSQFDTLEIPTYGLHVDISKPIETIINTIVEKIEVYKTTNQREFC